MRYISRVTDHTVTVFLVCYCRATCCHCLLSGTKKGGLLCKSYIQANENTTGMRDNQSGFTLFLL